MKYWIVFSAFLMMTTATCAPRMDQSAPRYSEKECPFCVTQKGACTYCEHNSGKCSFCEGSGKRTTVVPKLPNQAARPIEYEESCPYCKATGICRYCQGKGACLPCDGTGTPTTWNFFEKYLRSKANLTENQKSTEAVN